MYCVEYSDGKREPINGFLSKRLLIKEARSKAKKAGSETFAIVKGWDVIVVSTQRTEEKRDGQVE